MKYKNVVSIIIVFFVLATIHLYLSTREMDVGYRMENAQIELKQIQSDNRLLDSKLAAQESLEKIEKIAIGTLGMEPPQKIIFISSEVESR